MKKLSQLLDLIGEHRLYDLAHSYFAGMPHLPTYPPFLFGLTRKHGDLILEGGVSSAADSFAFGGHVGAHIDALCHFLAMECCTPAGPAISPTQRGL